jgi:hypothetical protein
LLVCNNEESFDICSIILFSWFLRSDGFISLIFFLSLNNSHSFSSNQLVIHSENNMVCDCIRINMCFCLSSHDHPEDKLSRHDVYSYETVIGTLDDFDVRHIIVVSQVVGSVSTL